MLTFPTITGHSVSPRAAHTTMHEATEAVKIVFEIPLRYIVILYAFKHNFVYFKYLFIRFATGYTAIEIYITVQFI